MRRTLTRRLLLGVLVSGLIPLLPIGAVLGQVPDPDLIFELDSQVSPTGTVTVDVRLTLPPTYLGGVSVWAIVLCHDPAELQHVSWDWGADAAVVEDGDPPSLDLIEMEPGRFGQTVLLGATLRGFFLMPGPDLELLRLTYEFVGDPTPAELNFCAFELGATSNVVYAGDYVAGTTIDGQVEIQRDFVRGDCNADQNLDLADSIFLEQYLFLSGDTPPCLSACDTNDDGAVDIADSITNLTYLFLSGGPLPAPFDSCGSDPTVDGVTCFVSNCP